jgi:CrcB protein
MLNFKQALIVGLGGGLGSIVRYKLGGFVLHHTGGANFPWSTFSVNLLGCLAIGILSALVERHDLFSPATRIFLFSGFLGGFTTYSAFAYESAFLIRKGLGEVAFLYTSVTVIAGLVLVWMGTVIVNILWRVPN